MGIDLKYGNVTVENEPGNPIGQDEPVFVIRARDELAIEAIDLYGELAEMAALPELFLQGILKVREAFQKWQQENSELVKMPD